MEYCKDPMGPPLRMKGIQLHGRTRKSHLVVKSEVRKGRVSSLGLIRESGSLKLGDLLHSLVF
jgi:hypothetical protein